MNERMNELLKTARRQAVAINSWVAIPAEALHANPLQESAEINFRKNNQAQPFIYF